MRWKLALLALGFALFALVGLHIRNRYALCDRYDPRNLLGKTPDEVEKTLGKPFHIHGQGDPLAFWQYQYGMDPEAVITFRDDRVAEVEFLYWACPPFSSRKN